MRACVYVCVGVNVVCAVDLEVFFTGSSQRLFSILLFNAKESKWHKSNSMFHRGVVKKGREEGQSRYAGRKK